MSVFLDTSVLLAGLVDFGPQSAPAQMLLHAVAESPEAAVQQGLAQLQAAEFVYETRLFPEAEYEFKHALTQEVAYAGLLYERRRVLHGQVVAAIERLYPNGLAEHRDRLVYHARPDSLETTVTSGNQVLLEVTSPDPGARRAMLASYFAPKSDFRKGLIKSVL